MSPQERQRYLRPLLVVGFWRTRSASRSSARDKPPARPAERVDELPFPLYDFGRLVEDHPCSAGASLARLDPKEEGNRPIGISDFESVRMLSLQRSGPPNALSDGVRKGPLSAP